MTVEIIENDGPGESGHFPWHPEERGNWYFITYETATGKSCKYVKRTAHAAAIGRTILAKAREHTPTIASVAVWERDSDADSWPTGVIENGQIVDMVDLPRTGALAVATDTDDPEWYVQEVEKNMEAAVLAQRAYNTARNKLIEACAVAVNDGDDEGGLSANTLARMVNGVISRPTLLKRLAVSEARASQGE